MALTQIKRRREDSTESDDPDNWPRFLVMQDQDGSGSLLKLSPFAIAKGIKGLAGEPKMIKKISQGLLLEVSKRSHSDSLLRSSMIANLPIKVTTHHTLNSCKGVIRCRDLADLQEQEIAQEMADQNVTSVKRIIVDKGRKPTDTYIVTFQTPHLPATVRIGYISVKVALYVPNPLRCYKCQGYGHGSGKCTHEERCSRCGQNHNYLVCTADEPFCVHCSGRHAASDRNCPKYLKEKEIVTIKYKDNITFFEARKRVEQSTSTPTYAAVTQKKPSTRSVEIQTDLTWPVDSDTPVDCSNTCSGPARKNSSQQTNTPAEKPCASQTDKPQNHPKTECTRSLSLDRQPRASVHNTLSASDSDDMEVVHSIDASRGEGKGFKKKGRGGRGPIKLNRTGNIQ